MKGTEKSVDESMEKDEKQKGENACKEEEWRHLSAEEDAHL